MCELVNERHIVKSSGQSSYKCSQFTILLGQNVRRMFLSKSSLNVSDTFVLSSGILNAGFLIVIKYFYTVVLPLLLKIQTTSSITGLRAQ